MMIVHRNAGIAGFPERSPFKGFLRFDAAKDFLEGVPHLFWHDVVEDRVEGGGEVVAEAGDEEHPVVDFFYDFALSEVDGHKALRVKGSPADEEPQHYQCWNRKKC